MGIEAMAPSLVRYSPSSTWLLFPLLASSEVLVDDLGPMVYGCIYCPRLYQTALSFADSKTLKEEKREELFESLKVNESIGWAVDVIDPRELSSKMLRKNKVNLNEISHYSAIGLFQRVMEMGVLLTEVYVDTVGDAEKYRVKLSERFSSVKFVVSKTADSLYPVVSGASIVAKVTRDRTLHDWVLDETSEKIERNFGSGYPADPETKACWKSTTTRYLDFRPWFASVGGHANLSSMTSLRSHGKPIEPMKISLTVVGSGRCS